MEATAHSRFQRYGTRKVSQVLAQIRGRRVLEAEEMLPSFPRACAGMVAKTLKSAASNFAIKAARSGRKLEPARLFVKSCWAGQGPMLQMKRTMPAPMGRANVFKRKVCHVTIVVADGAEG